MLTGTFLLQGLVVALFLHSMPMIASGLHVPSLRLRNQLLGTTAPLAKLRSFQVYNGKISSKESIITASETSVALQCRSGGSFSTEGDAISNCLKVVIAGAPAAGKGTQCENIKDKYGVVHLSTGDILRAAVKEGTPLGAKAKEYMDAGKLVPDELIIDVVCERLRQQDCSTQGWLLDGFPRTEAQAQALSAAGMVPDCFILLDVPEEVLVERVTGRRTDPETGKIYHMKFSPPESEEVTARLVQRSDDTEEKIKVRYRDFRANIDEIKASYEDKLVWVDGSLKKDEVTSMIFQALDTLVSEKHAATTIGQRLPSSSPSGADKSPLKIIIAGAPAAGKGTQCENIISQHGVVHLSTGDILRAAVKEGTPLGAKAKEYMDAGKLVPDELIIDVVCERLRQQDCSTQGWLLDGFPRTEAQAQALSAAGMVPDCFILLDVPEEVLVERVTGRRTDPETGKIYHMKFSPPESEEVAARLVQRSDDTEEKIKVRYRDFRANIDEIKASYEDKLVWVDGSLKKDEVTSMIFQALKFVKLEKQEDGNPSQTTAEKWSPGLLVSPPAQEAQASSPPTPTALGMTRMASAQGALRRMLNRLPSSPAATARTAPSRWGNRQARLSI